MVEFNLYLELKSEYDKLCCNIFDHLKKSSLSNSLIRLYSENLKQKQEYQYWSSQNLTTNNMLTFIYLIMVHLPTQDII